MDRHLLKLEPPYSIIYADGMIGRHIANIICQGAARAIYFNGLPEMPLDNLTLSNSLFVCRKGAEMHYAKNIVFDNVKIQQSEGDRVTKTDVMNFTEK